MSGKVKAAETLGVQQPLFGATEIPTGEGFETAELNVSSKSEIEIDDINTDLTDESGEDLDDLTEELSDEFADNDLSGGIGRRRG